MIINEFNCSNKHESGQELYKDVKFPRDKPNQGQQEEKMMCLQEEHRTSTQSTSFEEAQQQASNDFDAFVIEMDERLQQDRTVTLDAIEYLGCGSTPIPEWDSFDCSDRKSCLQTPQGICIACGEETCLPLLCRTCLEHIEEMTEQLECPWFISPDLCAARVEAQQGEMTHTGCGGDLAVCEARNWLYVRNDQEEQN